MAAYDESNHKRLIDQIGTISTFAEVADWDARAQAELQLITSTMESVARDLAQAQQGLTHAQTEHAGRGIAGRLLGGQRQINEHTATIVKLTQQQQHLEGLADELDGWIAYTPNDPAEQKILLKELKQHKKELQLKKRELAAAAREIRVSARQQTAQVSTSFAGVFVRGHSTAAGRGIRRQKEAALRPNESEKSALERQLLAVDRRILWAERLS